MSRYWLKTGIALVAVAALLLLFASRLVYNFYHDPLKNISATTTVRVYPNSGIHALADKLYAKGLIRYRYLFILFAELTGKGGKLRYGEYHVQQGMSEAKLLDNMVQGADTVKYRMTFIEGWTFRQVISALNRNNNIRHTLSDLSAQAIMKKINVKKADPEGWIFPDTYFFEWDATDLSVLKQGYAAMQVLLVKQWPRRASGLPYKHSYQALIVASMVEKEAKLAKERKKIAAVILRRMKIRMHLQIDATVHYGLQQPYSVPLSRQNLKQNTPYNTYMHYGLPPTPISMPGKASIMAALHPGTGKALFYVLKGNGAHVFSNTYHEHLEAVEKYRQRHRSKSNQRDIASHTISSSVAENFFETMQSYFMKVFVLWLARGA